MITDTIALLILAVIADLTRGVSLGFGFWLQISSGMTALILLTWWGIPYLARWFFHNVTETRGEQFLFVLATVCSFSYLAHFAKMEPIIGAFLAGAAFNRLIPENSALMNRVVFAGNTLFIPFFLISVGMLVNVSALVANPRSWFVAGTMVGVVIFTKYVAAWVGATFFGYDKSERNVMFGLTLVQAAATLAAVLVGYELRIFDEAVLNGAIAMIAVTCPLGAWMVDRYGRRFSEETIVAEHFPVSEQRLLIPLANPLYATRMMDLAVLLRDTGRPGAIYPITIVYDDENMERALARGEKLLAECLLRASSGEIPLHPSVRVDLNIADGIVRATRELRINCVLVGWGGEQTVSERFFGSVTEKLISICPARLLLCRLQHSLNTTKRILFLLPPLAEKRHDIQKLLQEAMFLSRQVVAELRVYLVGRTAGSLRQMVAEARSEYPLNITELDSMTQLRMRLLAEVAADDLILLLGERRGSVLWTPTSDGLSQFLAAQFSKNNILVAYPPFVSPGNIRSGVVQETMKRISLTCLPVRLQKNLNIEAALNAMVMTAFAGNEALIRDAGRVLSDSAQTFPVELMAGVFLFHAHCERTNQITLVVGMAEGAKTWKIVHAKEEAKILLALISPKGNAPEVHLEVLAELGRIFHNQEVVNALGQARQAEEVISILKKASDRIVV